MRSDPTKLDPARTPQRARATAGLAGADDWMACIGYEAANPSLHGGLLPRGIRWEESLDEVDSGCSDD